MTRPLCWKAPPAVKSHWSYHIAFLNCILDIMCSDLWIVALCLIVTFTVKNESRKYLLNVYCSMCDFCHSLYKKLCFRSGLSKTFTSHVHVFRLHLKLFVPSCSVHAVKISLSSNKRLDTVFSCLAEELP